MQEIIKDLAKKSSARGKKINLEEEFNKLDESEINKELERRERKNQEEVNKAIEIKKLKEQEKILKYIPNQYKGLSMNWLKDNYKGVEFQRALGECVRAVQNIDKLKKGLYIYGDTGIGKTSLLSTMAQALYMHKNKTISYMTEDDFINKIKQTYNKGATKTEMEVIQDIAKNEVVFIDEWGQNESQWAIKYLKILLDEIESKKHHVFITSNYDYMELANKYIKANPEDKKATQLLDRLSGSTELLEIKDKSHR